MLIYNMAPFACHKLAFIRTHPITRSTHFLLVRYWSLPIKVVGKLGLSDITRYPYFDVAVGLRGHIILRAKAAP
jgi:hypothetical protein